MVLWAIGRRGTKSKFLNDASRGIVYDLNEKQAKTLAKELHHEQDWRRFIHGLHPLEFREDVLIPREDGRAEVLCESFSTKNLLENTEVAGFVQLYIDQVQFRKQDDVGDVTLEQASYIRILPTSKSDGAIVLLADSNRSRPRILLVSEYRHNAQRYMVEACRGFGAREDRDEKETHRRERWEETWIPDAWVVDERDLGRAFSDSGKLRESPGYFLNFVRLPADKDAHIRGLKPVMTDPVWVPLPRFYEAIFAKESLDLDPTEYEFFLSADQRSELNTRAPINDGKLIIEDNFTITCALLALPELADYYKLSIPQILGR